jgi:hypothetical protein
LFEYGDRLKKETVYSERPSLSTLEKALSLLSNGSLGACHLLSFHWFYFTGIQMKRILRSLYFMLLFIVGAATASFDAQCQTVTCKIKNVTLSNGMYSFEVWGKASGGTLSVSQFQFAFNFNSSGLSVQLSYSPTLAPRFAPKYLRILSGDAGSWHDWSWSPWNVSDEVTLADTGSDGELIVTIVFTVTDPTQSAGISWHTSQCSFAGATTMTFSGGDNSPLPIQLASFKVGTMDNRSVRLTWTTLSETNNYGFYVRRDDRDITFIAGHGTTLDQHTYSYTENPGPGQHRYGLKQVDLDGTATFSETILMDLTRPTKFALEPNYPNPFNPSTRIAFSVTKEGPVSLRVYDILGREVGTLVNENRKAGQYNERCDGSRFASGVYMYVLQTAEGRLTGRMILSK